MNRTEKRNHFAQAKKNPDAIFCPVCQKKTMHIALPNEDTLDIFCPVCYNRREQGIKPGTRGCWPKEVVKGRYFTNNREVSNDRH